MTALLNYLHIIIILAGFLVMYFNRKSVKRMAGIAIATGFIVVVWLSVSPSYGPKGESPDLYNPPFEQSTAEMQDRLRKPVDTDATRATKLEDKMNWKNEVKPMTRDAEVKKPTPQP